MDQLAKSLATKRLMGGPPFVVLPGVFELVYTENTGAAFGLFAGLTPVLSVLTVLLLLAVCWKTLQMPATPGYFPLRLSFLFILAGGAGNLIDRVRSGFVVDFFYFVPIDFPKFNFADIYITAGILLFLALAVLKYKENDLAFLWKLRPSRTQSQT